MKLKILSKRILRLISTGKMFVFKKRGITLWFDKKSLNNRDIGSRWTNLFKTERRVQP